MSNYYYSNFFINTSAAAVLTFSDIYKSFIILTISSHLYHAHHSKLKNFFDNANTSQKLQPYSNSLSFCFANKKKAHSEEVPISTPGTAL